MYLFPVRLLSWVFTADTFKKKIKHTKKRKKNLNNLKFNNFYASYTCKQKKHVFICHKYFGWFS